jgi:segregation and condensation protein B
VIRGVSEAEVVECVRQLNQQYLGSEHAFTIVEHPDGFRLELCADLEPIRESFYGRARPITLNQAAIDCLALIAYQPGIAREQIEEQRGQPSGPILNQLVRRKLISIERKEQQSASEVKKGKTAHYFPTEKLLELAGLVSLEDLPQVEDLDMD